jgi:hypothetical protein
VALIAGLDGVEEDVANGFPGSHDTDDIIDAHDPNACPLMKLDAHEALRFVNDELATSSVIEFHSSTTPVGLNRVDDAQWRILTAKLPPDQLKLRKATHHHDAC